MIRYTLKCEDDHHFESWFQSAEAFEQLAKAERLTCPQCGSCKVEKALMAPRVMTPSKETTETTPVLANASSDVEKALLELRRKVEENSDYVGDKFVQEARAMHLGEKPERAIYGEARFDQARELASDGVPLMPLPFMPTRKSN
ncbi:MAG: DUF1178 family protein [Pseudomonadota bacterium]